MSECFVWNCPGVREAETKVYGRYHGTRHSDVNIEFLLDSLVLSIGRETTFSIEGLWPRIDSELGHHE